MNFAGNFNYIGNIDIEPLRERVEAITEEEWQNDPFRQHRYEAHRHTETIALVFDPDFRHSHPTRLPALEQYQDAIHPALEMVAEHFENADAGQALIRQYGLGYFIRASLVKLVAGGEIPQHQDGNFSLCHSHRIHVPVTTNDSVEFSVGKETIVMLPGEVIEINNRRLHSVANKGDSDRVHLLLDFVLPGEKCCCGQRLHPETLCNPRVCLETDQFRVPCNCHPEN